MPLEKQLSRKKINIRHLAIIALILAACDQNGAAPTGALEGKWVDVNSSTDTLSFESFGGMEALIVGRGTEMRGGFLLPKFGSGPYEYDLPSDDKISLRWYLSSSSNFKDYYFEHSGTTLRVEQFYDSPTPGTILTFRKISD